MTKKLREIIINEAHGLQIHVHKHDDGFKIHAVGPDVEKKVKKGMKVSSSDLDDFRQFGYKVKEMKKP